MDAGSNNSSATAQELTSSGILGTDFTVIAGDFDSQSDVDFYSITTPELSEAMSLLFEPDGPMGNGSAVGLSTVTVYSGDGTEVLAQLDVSNGSDSIFLPIPQETDIQISIGSPTDPLGSNNYYSVNYLTRDTTNQKEANEAGNNDSSGAETAVGVDNGDPDFASYFISGNLVGDSDTDWWSFSASTGDTISLVCASARDGAGVHDATVAVFDNPDSLALQTETETTTQDINWLPDGSLPPVNVTQTVTHFLRINASNFSNIVTGRSYRCGVFVITN